MRRLACVPVGRALVLGAAVMFGLFFVAAAVATGIAGRHGATVVAGVASYGYLAYALVVVGLWLRRRSSGVDGPVRAFLAAKPAMGTHVGEPMRLVIPPVGDDGATGQVNVRVQVAGPRGDGVADLVMARLGRRWEVLDGSLLVDGNRMPLRSPGS